MRASLLILLLLLPSGLSGQSGTAREIPYVATSPLRLPPGMNFGENAGVAVNSRGHVFVYSRTGSEGHILAPRAASLYEFDSRGNFLREIGADLYSKAWAHAVRIDREDNIWVVDNGSSVAVKLDPEGKVLRTFGRRSESVGSLFRSPPTEPLPVPPARDGYFNEPTDVAFDPAGNAYFSDGYRNARVAKYDANGAWVKSWGERGSAPGQFATPHGIAADDQGRVYVADRSNNRIQVFDGEGTFIRQISWEDVQRQAPVPAGYKPLLADFGVLPDGSYNSLWPNTICITPGPNPVIFTQDMFPGRIYKLSLTGEVLGFLGRDGPQEGQFGWIHAIACPSQNEIWVAELLTWRVQKLELK